MHVDAWKAWGVAAAIAAAWGSTAAVAERQPLPDLDPSVRDELQTYLSEHALAPEAYVLSKFSNHDVVFLGEYHRIRHDARLVCELIPLLDDAGVHLLGIEFAAAHDQEAIDRLVVSDRFDEPAARAILWSWWPWWGFQEYLDLFRAAWETNRRHGNRPHPFRILGLNGRQDWSFVWSARAASDPDTLRLVFPDGHPDSVMAETIQREVIGKGEKALIYSGLNHAFTRFHQPVVDERTGALVRTVEGRMGNRVHAAIGDRCFLIVLHAPWPARAGHAAPEVYPADGIIDAFFAGAASGDGRVGFDVAGSPFGRLPGATGLWSAGIDGFQLAAFCDGWIFQKPVSAYEGVHVVKGWFTQANRVAAIAQLANPDPRVKRTSRSVASLSEGLASDTAVARRFSHLW
jgi:hypothetical protein